MGREKSWPQTKSKKKGTDPKEGHVVSPIRPLALNKTRSTRQIQWWCVYLQNSCQPKKEVTHYPTAIEVAAGDESSLVYLNAEDHIR